AQGEKQQGTAEAGPGHAKGDSWGNGSREAGAGLGRLSCLWTAS
ncbi:unnamed protein product, partial [marine sediment metagenome]